MTYNVFGRTLNPTHFTSRAYTSYTTIRCGNRKMAERIEHIFTMETDSPVLDGIMGVQIPKDEGLSFLPSWGKVGL